VDSVDVTRALAAVSSVASTFDLPVKNVAIIQNSNKLALHLEPCDVFARVALAGQEVAEFEVDLAQRLVAAGSPVAALDPRIEPRVHYHDGFAVTFWTYYDEQSQNPLASADYASGLKRLHTGMRNLDCGATPHFTDRVEEAQHLVANRDQTPALNPSGRALLLDTLNDARQNIESSGAGDQLLHGEPHPGNIINTTNGPIFIDLETCCRGPVEFDLAHAPADISEHYLGLDLDLLNECRRLVLAIVTAWRWDDHDQFPNGRRHGRGILALLRAGPPWPTLGELDGYTLTDTRRATGGRGGML
jgi:Phosphotransferase enzyme family